ncbi:MAG: TetR-like C-terminal domain-containing protein, partial [Coriobacteriales bacterium]
KEFYQALVRPMKGVDDTFIRVVTHSLETLNNEIIAELSSTEGYEAEYASYFFAASQAMLVQKWIFDGFPIEPKELAALYKKMLNEYWLNQF